MIQNSHLRRVVAYERQITMLDGVEFPQPRFQFFSGGYNNKSLFPHSTTGAVV